MVSASRFTITVLPSVRRLGGRRVVDRSAPSSASTSTLVLRWRCALAAFVFEASRPALVAGIGRPGAVGGDVLEGVFLAVVRAADQRGHRAGGGDVDHDALGADDLPQLGLEARRERHRGHHVQLHLRLVPVDGAHAQPLGAAHAHSLEQPVVEADALELLGLHEAGGIELGEDAEEVAFLHQAQPQQRVGQQPALLPDVGAGALETDGVQQPARPQGVHDDRIGFRGDGHGTAAVYVRTGPRSAGDAIDVQPEAAATAGGAGWGPARTGPRRPGRPARSRPPAGRRRAGAPCRRPAAGPIAWAWGTITTCSRLRGDGGVQPALQGADEGRRIEDERDDHRGALGDLARAGPPAQEELQGQIGRAVAV